MSHFNSENLDQNNTSEPRDDDNYENDDFASFQLDTKTINLNYSNLTKYSKVIRETYLFSDILNRLPQGIQKFQAKCQLSTETVFIFFQLSQQNYNINENLTLTYKQCADLLKISDYLEVRKLAKEINEYIKRQEDDVDFVIKMIHHEVETNKKTDKQEYKINLKMEEMLASKINECLTNEKFSELPISDIYRIVKLGSKEGMENDKLFNFIQKSLKKFCVLFEFIEIDKLSENVLLEICELFINCNENDRICFDYMKYDLKMIRDLIEQKKNLQSQLEETKQINNQKIIELKRQIEKLEEEKEFLRKVNGQINASVKNGLKINAQINLTMKGLSLDSERSKYIVSTSDQETLGIEAYEKGEPITSLQMNTIDFICKPGTYYIRCIIFDVEGKHAELLSNAVITSGTSVSFCYEGKPTKISLIEGQYKLEVWGAKGGDSTGTKSTSSAPGHGGLGGYSSGILTLHQNENVYIYVGGEGHPADSNEGSTSKGGFPDGGGTKTGHHNNYTSVPGTGGGSTSIRVKEDTDYARVIVAGGGGGASGSSAFTNHGGFGGGLNGGCSNYWDKEPHTGSGTQIGSTHGVGYGCDGDAGSFGKGADGKYLSGRDSGGGGGGGWYGGGSGGYGANNAPGSGGGGSGWIFTEENFRKLKSDDSNNFVLDNSYYLTEPNILSGEDEKEIPQHDENGTGHSGNGFAKITPLYDCAF